MKTYLITDDKQSCLLDMYCQGKSFLWCMFFGWRKTIVISDSEQVRYYKVPYKVYQMSKDYLYEYFKK
jgi:hypothetical protein